MTKAFDSVVGIDYSQAFIDACNTMKGQGMMKYSMIREGELCDEFVAQVESELVISFNHRYYKPISLKMDHL